MSKNKISFRKIVYFDEQAATDLLLEKNNGQFTKIKEKAKEISGGAHVEAGTSKFLEKFLNISLAGNARGSASSIAQTQIKSTILTDFLNIDDPELFDDTCSLKITDDSLAFMRSAGNFFKMFNLKSGTEFLSPELANILNTVNIDNIDKILDQASGYYRMIGYSANKDEYFIVRFNFAGIRNNYKLTDLPQMKLRIIGVKVGSTNSLDISMESELGETVSESEVDEEDNRLSSYKDIDVIAEQFKEETINKRYEIIDAIIAGVE